MVNPQNELNVIICSVILTGITTSFLEHLDIFDEMVVDGSPIASMFICLLFFCLIIMLMCFVMFKVMTPIWSTSVEKRFLKEYQRVIRKMMKKKNNGVDACTLLAKTPKKTKNM